MWASTFNCFGTDIPALVELDVDVTPDSWELPIYLAGDVLDMGRYRRDRDRFVVPDRSWTPGQDAKVHEVDFAGTHDMRQSQRDLEMLRANRENYRSDKEWSDPTPSTWEDNVHRVGEIEPYDPASHHEPAEMYSQDSLDDLERAGFEPQEPGVWKREVKDEEGNPLGGSHFLMYEPGHRRPSDNKRAPWHLTTDPETVGVAFSTLRGHRGALRAADADVASARSMPKQARHFLFAVAGCQTDSWVDQ